MLARVPALASRLAVAPRALRTLVGFASLSTLLALTSLGCRARGGPAPPSDGAPDLYEGEHAYAFHCAKCHAPDRAAAGPSLREITLLYGAGPGGPDAIVRWAKAPGRKRPGADPMPSFAMLGDETLRNVAVYMIATGAR